LLLLVTTWLAAVRFLLYPSLSAADPRWLATAGSAVFNFTAGLRGELILLLGNFVLWWRISSYTDRELSFFSVGLTFRLGLLLAILGNALLAHFARQPQTVAVTYFILFFAFGLASVALARIDQKAVGANNSQGSLLPWSRLAQLLLAVATVMALAIAVATVYTPATLRSGLRALAPVGRLLQWLLIQVTLILFTVLSPVLEAIARVLAGLVGEPVEQPPVEPLVSGEYVSLADIVREWPLLRYCLVGGIIALALGLLLLFFVRTAVRLRQDEAEERATEETGFDARRLGRGRQRLAAWWRLLRRYGPSRRLLDAISVENIYANLVRIARRRGYPRPPAQPPDTFLPTLGLAFPGHDVPLARITAAYLRIHYGEHPLQPGELDQLRADFQTVTAPPEENCGDARPA
jgi:hypothetical protein